MACMTHDLFVRHAVAVGRGHEPGAQAVWANRFSQRAFNAGQGGAFEQNLANGVGAEPRAGYIASTADFSKKRARRDLALVEPGLQRCDRAGFLITTRGESNFGAFALLICLGARDGQFQAFVGPRDVGDVEPHKFGSAQCAGEANQQQRAIARAREVRATHVAELPDLGRRQRRGPSRGTAMGAGYSAQRLADGWVLGVQGRAGHAAGPGDRGYPAPKRRQGIAFAGGREIGADHLRRRWHGGEPVLVTPGAVVGQIGGVSFQGRRRVGGVLVGLGFGQGQGCARRWRLSG